MVSTKRLCTRESPSTRCVLPTYQFAAPGVDVFPELKQIDLNEDHMKPDYQIGRIFLHRILPLRFKGARARLPLFCTTDRNAMVVISLKPQKTLKFSKH